MKILFVYKGPKNPIVEAQAQSLVSNGMDIIKFPLMINHPWDYFVEYLKLLVFVKSHRITLIHAHYSYSGMIAGLTFHKTICSLMGSDVFSQHWFIIKLTKLFHRVVWKNTIVKSKQMQAMFPKSIVIPNGVNLAFFRPLEKKWALSHTPLDPKRKNIIFVVEKFHRNSKNFQLAKTVYRDFIDTSKVALNLVTDKKQDSLVNYYNAADVFWMTSTSEGSPNTVKEAMACNCPIVSTDVGDIQQITGTTKGCFITSFNATDIAEHLNTALKFGSRTKGREQIKALGLDSDVIAGKIIKLYLNF